MMVPKFLSVLLLGALATSLALGQDDKPTAKKPPQDKQATPAAAQPAKGELTLAVSGLTPENAAKVESALEQVSLTEYECPECGDVRATAGECKACETELEESSRPVFKEVMPSAEKSAIAFQMAPDAHVRLSWIEKALRGNSVQVPREKLTLTPPAILVFADGTREGVALLQTAFREAKMTDAQVSLDPKTQEIHVRFKQTAPTWTSVAELGSKLAQPLRLTDVIWGKVPTKS